MTNLLWELYYSKKFMSTNASLEEILENSSKICLHFMQHLTYSKFSTECLIIWSEFLNFKINVAKWNFRADHCAYLCYRDACTAAVFTPATAPASKGTCERRFDVAEKCSAALRRDYYYKTTKPVYLQCFRCRKFKIFYYLFYKEKFGSQWNRNWKL